MRLPEMMKHYGCVIHVRSKQKAVIVNTPQQLAKADVTTIQKCYPNYELKINVICT